MYTIRIKAKPGSRINSFEYLPEGLYSLKIKALPIDGKANEYLISYLAEILGIRKNQVHIKSGHTSKIKTIELEATPEVIKFLEELKSKA
ncbi:MAG: DUF167 domain-containing protein [Bacteroidia bacterium]|nr:DUF167 domain-containing protein [Bacteroidia bacterium]